MATLWPGYPQDLAAQLFAFSIIPYSGFLYCLTKSKETPPLALGGFYFLLVFVFGTIPAGIYGRAFTFNTFLVRAMNITCWSCDRGLRKQSTVDGWPMLLWYCPGDAVFLCMLCYLISASRWNRRVFTCGSTVWLLIYLGVFLQRSQDTNRDDIGQC